MEYRRMGRSGLQFSVLSFAIEGFGWLKDKWVAEDKLNRVRKLTEFAGKLGTSVASLSIAWCIRNPNVTTAILGATKKEQLHGNLKALEVLTQLTPQIMEQLDAIMSTKPVVPEV